MKQRISLIPRPTLFSVLQLAFRIIHGYGQNGAALVLSITGLLSGGCGDGGGGGGGGKPNSGLLPGQPQISLNEAV